MDIMPGACGWKWRSVLAAAAVCFASCPAVWAQDKAAEPSLDDLLQITPAPQPQKPAPAPPEAEPGRKLDRDMKNELAREKPGDAFQKAVMEMSQAADQLDQQHDAGLTTQRVQRSILSRLDQVIAAAEQQASKSKGGKPSQQKKQESGSKQNASQQQQKQQGKPGQKPGQGQPHGTESNPNAGLPPGVQATTQGGPLEEHRAEWGNLPPRLRDELIQGIGDKFSPIYRKMTEDYYRRLAEEARP